MFDRIYLPDVLEEKLNNDFIQALIEPYAPTLPVDSLVFELNRLYHSFEAKGYDQTHPELYQQLPPIWSQMINSLPVGSEGVQWNVLDFGCGTGFEATRIINEMAPGSIRSLTCYDPSVEMLDHCKNNIASKLSCVRFCSDISEVIQCHQLYDLLLTNSLLHHLPSPAREIARLENILTPDAWWLMGHEPSRRYHQNAACSALLSRYEAERKLAKLVSVKECFRKLKSMTGRGETMAQATADAAHQAGLFTKRPSAFVIGRLVDFNVPHSSQEAEIGRGFDFETMNAELAFQWKRQWVKTYSFMGPFPEVNLTPKWRDRCHGIEASYPFDGANFCSVWSRN